MDGNLWTGATERTVYYTEWALSMLLAECLTRDDWCEAFGRLQDVIKQQTEDDLG